MDAGDLTDLQIQILKLVHDDDGRTPTEGIYDLVEEARPSPDPEGAPYETSREELGALEGAGVLDADYDTTWVMGASVFTEKGRQISDELFGERRRRNALKRRLMR